MSLRHRNFFELTTPFTREGSQVQSLSRPPLRHHLKSLKLLSDRRFCGALVTAHPSPFEAQRSMNTGAQGVRNPCAVFSGCSAPPQTKD
jgi:hypothetical protein